MGPSSVWMETCSAVCSSHRANLATVWDPAIYLEFADERARPFGDLTVHVLTDFAERVVDLGCGPGQLTATLADRWPEADILGIDSSPQMIDKAQVYAHSHLRFEVQDLREWRRGAGRRDRQQRDAAVGARSPPAAARSGRRAQAGRLAGLPGARQLRRAQPSVAARPRRRSRSRSSPPATSSGRARRGDLPRGPDCPGLCGGRLGDDLSARAHRSGPGVPLDLRHRRAAGAHSHCRATGGRSSSRSTSDG